MADSSGTLEARAYHTRGGGAPAPDHDADHAARESRVVAEQAPLSRAGNILFSLLITAGDANTVPSMPTATLVTPKKTVRRRTTKNVTAFKIKAVPGSPLAGLEHMIGCVSLPRDPRPRSEILRARYLADHNT